MSSYRIGIDAGGTKVAYGLFDEANTLLERAQHPTPILADGPEFTELVAENVEKLLAKTGTEKRELQGIGVCMPSFILFDRGYVCMTSAMVNIRDFAMRDYMVRRLGVPVVLDNDSNVAALAEHRYGAGRGSRDMIYVAASTGIGSGLILNGALFRGSYGWAGECGHMLITPDEGVECGCRNRGCFMSWASGRYLPQQIRSRAAGRETAMDLNGALDGEELLRACREGDPLALEVLEQAAQAFLELFPDGAKIVEVGGQTGHNAQILRHDGYVSIMKDHPEFELIASQNTEHWAADEAQSIMEDFVMAYGDQIDGVFCHWDNGATGCINALKANGMDNVPIVGVDGCRAGFDQVNDGGQYATIMNNFEADSLTSLELATKWFNGETVDSVNFITPDVVTLKNINEFTTPEW